MFKVSTEEAIRDSDSFVEMLQKAGVNVFVEKDSDFIEHLVFPDVIDCDPEYNEISKIKVFEIDDENEDFIFDHTKYSESVFCSIFDYKEISFYCDDFLKAIQYALNAYDLILVDVATHGDDYVYFISNAKENNALEHIKAGLELSNSNEKLESMIEKRPKKIEGKMDIWQIRNRIHEKLGNGTANLFVLKDLLDDIAPDMQYEVVEPEDGSEPYIKEIPFED